MTDESGKNSMDTHQSLIREGATPEQADQFLAMKARVTDDLSAEALSIVTDAMVEAAVLAGSRGIKGCEYAPGQFCGGTHTDCYYRGILTAALAAGGFVDERR